MKVVVFRCTYRQNVHSAWYLRHIHPLERKPLTWGSYTDHISLRISEKAFKISAISYTTEYHTKHFIFVLATILCFSVKGASSNWLFWHVCHTWAAYKNSFSVIPYNFAIRSQHDCNRAPLLLPRQLALPTAEALAPRTGPYGKLFMLPYGNANIREFSNRGLKHFGAPKK